VHNKVAEHTHRHTHTHVCTTHHIQELVLLQVIRPNAHPQNQNMMILTFTNIRHHSLKSLNETNSQVETVWIKKIFHLY